MSGVERDAIEHRMVPGTHEWPRTPECTCGALWLAWTDQCVTRAAETAARSDR